MQRARGRAVPCRHDCPTVQLRCQLPMRGCAKFVDVGHYGGEITRPVSSFGFHRDNSRRIAFLRLQEGRCAVRVLDGAVAAFEEEEITVH